MAALLREAMKVPISNRLLLCAEFVPRVPARRYRHGSRVSFHIPAARGYLPVRHGGRPARAAAAEGPRKRRALRRVRKMRFFLSDGLQGIPPDAADTIIMAGMGGDLMVRILEAAPWVCDDRYTLILQPQSAGQALRQYLAEHGFAIEREALARDGHFFYTVLRAKRDICPRFRRGSNTPRRSCCGRTGLFWGRIWPGSKQPSRAQSWACKEPTSRKSSAITKPRLRKSEK